MYEPRYENILLKRKRIKLKCPICIGSSVKFIKYDDLCPSCKKEINLILINN